MEIDKQRLLISYLVSSQTVFTKVNPILNPAHWDPKIKPVLTFVQKYFNEYKAPPTANQIKVETGQVIEINPDFSRQELSYAETELETFCRNKAIESAILSSPALLEEQKFGEIEKLIRDAITISLQRNIGIDYFEDPELRLRNLVASNNLISTGWDKLNEALGGGVNRKEMILFAAPPGVGKSLTMSNLGRNLMLQGLNGVYFTLELSEEIVCKRFDSMFAKMSQKDLLLNITKASIEIKKQSEGNGKIFVKRMPESSTNANHLRAYLKEFEIVNGFTPDFIVVDYLDLMASVQQVSAENTFIRDKFISEELRALANEYNCIMITASQLNRSSLQLESQDDVGQANIAGGLSKINTTDNAVSILQDPQQKARGEMKFKLLKTRSSNGVGSSYMLKFDQATLVLSNFEEDVSTTSKLANTLSSYAKAGLNAKTEASSSKVDPNNLPFRF
jgi:archaellum biogenesis ATPase FlaH